MILPDSLTTETLVAQTSNCTLTVTVVRDPAAEALHLQYQVRNTSALPLYFLNQLWENAWRDTNRNQLVFYALPNLANVESSADSVTVSKKVVDVPYGLLVEARRIPLMTCIASGAEYIETVVLPLPLRLNNTYQSGPLNVPAVPRPLYFELGYLSLEPVAETAIREVATPGGSAFGIDAFPASEQTIIGVGPFQQSFLVLADERPALPPSDGEWTPWG
jgi:hypothetical protein